MLGDRTSILTLKSCQVRVAKIYFCSKVQIFWEGHKIWRNLHLTFVLSSASQKISQNFVAFSEYMNFKKTPQKYETISHLIWQLLSKSQIKWKIVSKIVAFLENLNFKIEEISGISGRWTNNNLDFTLFRHSPQLIYTHLKTLLITKTRFKF